MKVRAGPAGHPCSWAGMALGTHRSAGERQSGRMSQANRRSRPLLAQAAWAASHVRGAVLGATYARWMGRKRASVGVGHKVPRVIDEVREGPMVDRERPRPEKAT